MNLFDKICWLSCAAPSSPEPTPAGLFLLAGAFFVATIVLLL